MPPVYEGRTSESPFIQMVWRGRIPANYDVVCPADANWNLLFMRHEGKTRVTVEGATPQFVPKTQPEGAEFLVIKFASGIFMPHLPPEQFVNTDELLPEASSRSFWLKGSAWELPDYDNVETFVARLVREDLLVCDPIIKTVLQDHPTDVSVRTVRRRFLRATGISQGTFRQIERAKQAAALLESGVPVLDAVFEAGYADQPHMTRSLRRFYGQTPAEIAGQRIP